MMAYDEGGVRVHCGDCREVLAMLPDASIDAVVTDPPYGIGFMGREWDTFAPATVLARRETLQRRAKTRTEAYPEGGNTTSQGGGVAITYDESVSGNQRFQAWVEEWARECLRVLKPGGHMAVFGGARTFHRLTCGIEDAGFQIRDVLTWLYGSGFPKSRNLDGDWQGWGTALKPGWEPVILARKPLIGTVAANVTEHGTGALNIDGCRIEGQPWTPVAPNAGGRSSGLMGTSAQHPGGSPHDAGRWPANVVLDEAAAELLDQQSGASASRVGKPRGSAKPGDGWGMTATGSEYDDFGGASRFFYTAKASRAERNAGLQGGQVWESADLNRAVGELSRLLRDTSVDTMLSPDDPEWNMIWFGNSTTGQSPKGCRSIIETVSRLITESITSNYSQHSTINASIQGATKTILASGLSLADVAEFINLSQRNSMSEKMASHLDVVGAALPMLWQLSGRARRGNFHSTVKPLALMRWLVRLVTPPGGVILDPFGGSGTTAVAAYQEGFGAVLIEREQEYVEIEIGRIRHAQKHGRQARLELEGVA